MLGPETIAKISDVAAYRAAEEGRYPLTIWQEEDIRHLPFLGDYCPPGWRPARWSEVFYTPRNVWRAAAEPRPDPRDEAVYFTVDSTGFGSRHEPALTHEETTSYILDHKHLGWAIVESGEFQVVVAAFVRDPEATGTPAPDRSAVECDECGDVHGPLEECDPEAFFCSSCRRREADGSDPCPECPDYEEPEYVSRCPACGDVIDYCQGHGEIGDPAGRAILDAHDAGDHRLCHPDGCEEVPHLSESSYVQPSPFGRS